MAAIDLNWLDVLVLVFVFYSISQGIRFGFIHQLFSVLQIVAAYVISISYFHLLGDFLNEVLNIGDMLDGLFDFHTALIEGIGHVLVNITAFLILFFATKILINFIGEIIGVGTFLPLVGTANKLLGGVFGFVKGLVIATIFMGIMYVLPWEFFQESLWNSEFFIFSLEVWPQMLLMLENFMELNLSELLE